MSRLETRIKESGIVTSWNDKKSIQQNESKFVTNKIDE